MTQENKTMLSIKLSVNVVNVMWDKLNIPYELGKRNKNYIKLNEKYHNIISKHLKENKDDLDNHYFHWDEVKILYKESNFYKRLFAEII